MVFRKQVHNLLAAARGEGIDDYFAVSWALVERASEIEYWAESESGHKSDHVAMVAESN